MVELFKHQSNLVVASDVAAAAAMLRSRLKDSSVADCIVHDYRCNFLSIDSIREAKITMDIRTTDTHAYIFSFNYIKDEAQNAMLKLLEEPPRNVYIYIVVNNRNLLLPTVLSRLFEMKLGSGDCEASASGTSNADAIHRNVIKFLSTEQINRMKLDFVELILDSKDEEDKVDKAPAILFVNALLEEVMIQKSKNTINISANTIQNLAELCSNLNVIGFSIKSVLEYYALILPKLDIK